METLTEIVLENRLEGRVLTNALISNLLHGSSARKWGLVNRAMKTGELIRLKRGIYILDPAISKEQISIYSLANSIVLESYISFESALAFHNWMQEEPVEVRSCIPRGRSRSFHSVLGDFDYRRIPLREGMFFLGVGRYGDSSNAVLVAGEERAAGDTIFARGLEWEGIIGLCERLRVDVSCLETLDTVLLEKLSDAYRSPRVRDYLKKLSSALGGG